MSTFSLKVKDEIMSARPSECCMMAMLSAIIRTAGYLTITAKQTSISILTHNQSMLNFINTILHTLYGINCQYSSSDSNMIAISEFTNDILRDCGILQLVDGQPQIVEGIDEHLIIDECCSISYIKGAFLGSGSVSISDSGYHLEIVLTSPKIASDIAHILAQHNIISKLIGRGEKKVLYIKDSESISDFLALVGASRAVLALNAEVSERYAARDYARAGNCLSANIDKTLTTSARQIYAFRSLKNSPLFSQLAKDIVDTAELRLENPEMSYDEMASILKISKSGIRHRLKKLEKLCYENNS